MKKFEFPDGSYAEMPDATTDEQANAMFIATKPDFALKNGYTKERIDALVNEHLPSIKQNYEEQDMGGIGKFMHRTKIGAEEAAVGIGAGFVGTAQKLGDAAATQFQGLMGRGEMPNLITGGWLDMPLDTSAVDQGDILRQNQTMIDQQVRPKLAMYSDIQKRDQARYDTVKNIPIPERTPEEEQFIAGFDHNTKSLGLYSSIIADHTNAMNEHGKQVAFMEDSYVKKTGDYLDALAGDIGQHNVIGHVQTKADLLDPLKVGPDLAAIGVNLAGVIGAASVGGLIGVGAPAAAAFSFAPTYDQLTDAGVSPSDSFYTAFATAGLDAASGGMAAGSNAMVKFATKFGLKADSKLAARMFELAKDAPRWQKLKAYGKAATVEGVIEGSTEAIQLKNESAAQGYAPTVDQYIITAALAGVSAVPFASIHYAKSKQALVDTQKEVEDIVKSNRSTLTAYGLGKIDKDQLGAYLRDKGYTDLAVDVVTGHKAVGWEEDGELTTLDSKGNLGSRKPGFDVNTVYDGTEKTAKGRLFELKDVDPHFFDVLQGSQIFNRFSKGEVTLEDMYGGYKNALMLGDYSAFSKEDIPKINKFIQDDPTVAIAMGMTLNERSLPINMLNSINSALNPDNDPKLHGKTALGLEAVQNTLYKMAQAAGHSTVRDFVNSPEGDLIIQAVQDGIEGNSKASASYQYTPGDSHKINLLINKEGQSGSDGLGILHEVNHFLVNRMDGSNPLAKSLLAFLHEINPKEKITWDDVQNPENRKYTEQIAEFAEFHMFTSGVETIKSKSKPNPAVMQFAQEAIGMLQLSDAERAEANIKSVIANKQTTSDPKMAPYFADGEPINIISAMTTSPKTISTAKARNMLNRLYFGNENDVTLKPIHYTEPITVNPVSRAMPISDMVDEATAQPVNPGDFSWSEVNDIVRQQNESLDALAASNPDLIHLDFQGNTTHEGLYNLRTDVDNARASIKDEKKKMETTMKIVNAVARSLGITPFAANKVSKDKRDSERRAFIDRIVTISDLYNTEVNNGMVALRGEKGAGVITYRAKAPKNINIAPVKNKGIGFLGEVSTSLALAASKIVDKAGNLQPMFSSLVSLSSAPTLTFHSNDKVAAILKKATGRGATDAIVQGKIYAAVKNSEKDQLIAVKKASMIYEAYQQAEGGMYSSINPEVRQLIDELRLTDTLFQKSAMDVTTVFLNSVKPFDLSKTMGIVDRNRLQAAVGQPLDHSMGNIGVHKQLTDMGLPVNEVLQKAGFDSIIKESGGDKIVTVFNENQVYHNDENQKVMFSPVGQRLYSVRKTGPYKAATDYLNSASEEAKKKYEPKIMNRPDSTQVGMDFLQNASGKEIADFVHSAWETITQDKGLSRDDTSKINFLATHAAAYMDSIVRADNPALYDKYNARAKRMQMIAEGNKSNAGWTLQAGQSQAVQQAMYEVCKIIDSSGMKLNKNFKAILNNLKLEDVNWFMNSLTKNGVSKEDIKKHLSDTNFTSRLTSAVNNKPEDVEKLEAFAALTIYEQKSAPAQAISWLKPYVFFNLLTSLSGRIRDAGSNAVSSVVETHAQPAGDLAIDFITSLGGFARPMTMSYKELGVAPFKAITKERTQFGNEFAPQDLRNRNTESAWAIARDLLTYKRYYWEVGGHHMDTQDSTDVINTQIVYGLSDLSGPQIAARYSDPWTVKWTIARSMLYVGQVMTAIDKLTSISACEVHGKQMDIRLTKWKKDGTYDENIKKIAEQDWLGRLSGKDPNGQFESLEEYVKAMQENPYNLIHARALQIGARASTMNTNEFVSAAGKLGNTLDAAIKIPVYRTFVHPFIGWGGRTALKVMSYVPVQADPTFGALSVVGTLLDPRFANKGFKNTSWSNTLTDLAARQIVGQVFAQMIAMALAHGDIVPPPKDDDDKERYKDNPNVMPYSFKIWNPILEDYTYAPMPALIETPMTFIINGIMKAQEAEQYGADSDEANKARVTLNKVVEKQLGQMFFDNIDNTDFIQGAFGLSAESKATYATSKFTGSILPASSMMREINSAYSLITRGGSPMMAPWKADSKGLNSLATGVKAGLEKSYGTYTTDFFVGMFGHSVPGFEVEIPVEINYMGHKISKNDFMTIPLPWQWFTESPSLLHNKIESAWAEMNVYPTPPPAEFTINKKKYKLTPEMQRDYALASGSILMKHMDPFVNGENYKNMNIEKKQKKFKSIWENARDAAKSSVYKHYKEELEKTNP